jgi:hypothetical protein
VKELLLQTIRILSEFWVLALTAAFCIVISLAAGYAWYRFINAIARSADTLRTFQGYRGPFITEHEIHADLGNGRTCYLCGACAEQLQANEAPSPGALSNSSATPEGTTKLWAGTRAMQADSGPGRSGAGEGASV